MRPRSALFLGCLLVAAWCAAGQDIEPVDPGMGIALRGNVAFVAHHKGIKGISSVDVSDPKNPTCLNTLQLDGFPQALALLRDLAYVVNGTKLIVVDISRPSELRLAQELSIADDPVRGPQGVALLRTRAYLACRAAGIVAVDLSDASYLRVAERLKTPNFARGVTWSGGCLYVADSKGLGVVDISRKDDLKLIGYAETEGCAEKTALMGCLAYVATGKYGVEIFDVTDPSKPAAKGKWADMSPWYGSYVHALAVARGHAYLADMSFGLFIYGLSDLKRLSMAGVAEELAKKIRGTKQR